MVGLANGPDPPRPNFKCRATCLSLMLQNPEFIRCLYGIDSSQYCLHLSAKTSIDAS